MSRRKFLKGEEVLTRKGAIGKVTSYLKGNRYRPGYYYVKFPREKDPIPYRSTELCSPTTFGGFQKPDARVLDLIAEYRSQS